MKRLLTFLLAFALLLSAVPAAFATEPEEQPEETEAVRNPDECGEGITWEFEGGILYIRGDGKMDDFEEGKEPWRSHKDEIEEVIIQGKLTCIGAYAFKDYDSLLAVDFGSALYEIGPEAFRSCDGLNAIWLPASFKIFGESSFQSCKNLKEIHCSGRFPSFRQNSMWDSYLTIYFPAEKPWNVENIQQLETAFKGRVEFIASDGTDPYDPDGTDEETEPEETVPETTAPEITEPEITEPETTEPETETPTEPPLILPNATEPEITEPETQAPEMPSGEEGSTAPGRGIHTGLIIVIAVLAGLGLGFLIFGRKKGKYVR